MPCKHIKKIEGIASEKIIYNVDYDNIFDVCKYIRLHKEKLGSVEMEATMCSLDGCESEEDIKRLRNRISELEGKTSNLEESSNTQIVLRRGVETERNDLQVAKRSLELKVNSLETSNWNLQSTNDNLREDLRKRDEDIKWGKGELVKTQKDRDDYKNKWVLSEKEVKEITNSFNTLQIENNRNKDKIKELKSELGQSREEYLNQKLELKEEKLEILTQQLGINWGQITNLRNAYQQLIDAQRNNFNPANINAANANISNIKTALSNAGVNPTNKKKVCHKCKKITELEIELNQVHQQQYEARQEVPPRNN